MKKGNALNVWVQEFCNNMIDFGDDDNKTIFTSDLDPDEKAAVKSGEERGKRVAMAENPERFGMARQRALNKEKFDRNYARIDWSIK